MNLVHVPYTARVQNPNQRIPDDGLCREDVAIAKDVMRGLRTLGRDPVFDTDQAVEPAFPAATKSRAF